MKIPEQKFVCLFSILCFGKPRDNLFLGDGCQAYNFNGDVISVHCKNDYELSVPFSVRDIHTLYLVGVHREFFHLQLVDLSFRHLIIRDWDMSNYYNDINKVVFTINRHQSFTAQNVQNLQAWRWSEYEFGQIYIQGSSITRIGSQRLSDLLAKRLFSWKMVELYIIDCQLLSIDPNVFSHTPFLRTLTLSHNTLSSILSESFPYELRHLWLLDLSYNSLTYLDQNLFRRLPALIELNLNHNHLTELSFDLIKPVWFQLNLIHLLENRLHCRKLCWSLQMESFPHPISFDQTTCSNDYLKNLVVGTMNFILPICVYPWNLHQANSPPSNYSTVPRRLSETH